METKDYEVIETKSGDTVGYHAGPLSDAIKFAEGFDAGIYIVEVFTDGTREFVKNINPRFARYASDIPPEL